jgi:two-component system, NtrC family, sensor kinase
MFTVCQVGGILLKPSILLILGHPSLTRYILIQLLFRVMGIFILSALLTYGHIIGQVQLSTQEQLQNYVTERGKREEAIFQLAADATFC